MGLGDSKGTGRSTRTSILVRRGDAPPRAVHLPEWQVVAAIAIGCVWLVLAWISASREAREAWRAPFNAEEQQHNHVAGVSTWLGDAAVSNWALVLVGSVTFIVIAWQAKETRRAAVAAEESARVSADNTRLTRSSLGLTRQEIALTRQSFVLTHRPKIVVRNIAVPHLAPGEIPERLDGTLWVTNIGFSRGKILRLHTQWLVVDRLPMQNPVITADPLRIDVRLWPGRSKQLPLSVFDVGVDDYIHIVGRGAAPGYAQKELYLLGVVKYWDDLRNLRRTVFCRKFNRDTGRFEKVDDADYEYAD